MISILGCSERRELVLASTVEEPAPAYAEAIVEALKDRGITVRHQPMTASADVLAAVEAGAVDLGIVENGLPNNGRAHVVAPVYLSILHVLARRDLPSSDVHSLLSQQAVYDGSSGTAGVWLGRVLAHVGGRRPEYRMLDNPWSETVDVFVVLGDIMEEQSLAALTDYRLIDLDELSDGPMIAPLAMKYQDWQQFTIPGGLYPSLGQRSALETLGVDSLLVAHAGLSDNDVFEIAEEISARRLRFSSISPLARYAQNRDVADARWSYPRHAGAERYLARDRPGFVERYAEVGAFAIALLAALASAWVALQRWRQGRHKDVLDEYLRSALAARAGARNAGVEELRATRERVVALQDEVFGLLIEERIHAGSDLTTFVTMSNQVLRELDQRRALLATATPVEK